MGIAVGQGTGRGGIGGTPGTIKALVAVMVVSDSRTFAAGQKVDN